MKVKTDAAKFNGERWNWSQWSGGLSVGCTDCTIYVNATHADRKLSWDAHAHGLCVKYVHTVDCKTETRRSLLNRLEAAVARYTARPGQNDAHVGYLHHGRLIEAVALPAYSVHTADPCTLIDSTCWPYS